MSSAPFLVGQMFSLADTLHKEYCKHVRANKSDSDKEDERSSGMPRQLIGNAAMCVALDNPEDAFGRLAERILIYQSWANTAGGEGLGLAKWTLGQMGQVSNELASCEVPKRTNDADKAQILLGYLARPEGRVPGNLETNNTDTEVAND